MDPVELAKAKMAMAAAAEMARLGLGNKASNMPVIWTDDYSEAIGALKTGHKKKAVICFHTTNCIWCDRLKASFVDPDVEKAMGGFLSISLDDSHYVAKAMQVNRFPTTMIIDENRNVLKRQEGYMDPLSLKNFLTNGE